MGYGAINPAISGRFIPPPRSQRLSPTELFTQQIEIPKITPPLGSREKTPTPHADALNAAVLASFSGGPVFARIFIDEDKKTNNGLQEDLSPLAPMAA